MNIIIPMAGMGKRMRPHTLSVPKPLLKIAGKSIVSRIVEDIKESTGKKIDSIHFVVGNFGIEVENSLIDIAKRVGAKGFIHYQLEALGTAHAIYCAKEALQDEVLVAFADTLFVGNFNISDHEDCIIWTMKVKNPEQYGVVLSDKDNNITGFVEKPKEFISDKAIIGIYYFKNGELLKKDIESLIENKVIKSGEYQLTDNLLNLFNQGLIFKSQEISEWLDCGNKNEFLKSNERIVELKKFRQGKYNSNNSTTNEKVYIGNQTEIITSTIGDYTSIGDNCVIKDSELSNCIIGDHTVIESSIVLKSMIGNNCKIIKCKGVINFGDFTEYEGL
jgi:glucose-1-phosphate thymidylyltransferase